jgi:hypothetical protein
MWVGCLREPSLVQVQDTTQTIIGEGAKVEKYWEGSQEDQHEQGFSFSLSLSLSLSFIAFACEEESSLTKKNKTSS